MKKLCATCRLPRNIYHGRTICMTCRHSAKSFIAHRHRKLGSFVGEIAGKIVADKLRSAM